MEEVTRRRRRERKREREGEREEEEIRKSEKSSVDLPFFSLLSLRYVTPRTVEMDID